MSRTRRTFSEAHKVELLAQARGWRHDCQRLQAGLPILGDAYNAVTGVMHAIDDLAGTLTGNREFLWKKAHSIGEGPNRKQAPTPAETAETELRALLRQARGRAVLGGVKHSLWDAIFDAESLLAGTPTRLHYASREEGMARLTAVLLGCLGDAAVDSTPGKPR